MSGVICIVPVGNDDSESGESDGDMHAGSCVSGADLYGVVSGVGRFCLRMAQLFFFPPGGRLPSGHNNTPL